MKWKMLFRIGLTVIILVAILLFYLNNVLQKNNKERLSEIVQSENLAFKEAFVHNSGHFPVDSKDHAKNLDANSDQVENQLGQNVAVRAGEHKHGDLKKDIRLDNLQGQHAGNSAVNVDRAIGDAERSDNSVKNVPKADHLAEHDQDRSPNSDEGKGQLQDYQKRKMTAPGLQPQHHRVGKQVNTQVHTIHLVVVACGDRAEEVMVMLKSAVVLTTSTPLVLHIFAERELHTFFTQQLDFWPREIVDRVEYRVYDITYPAGENAEEWKRLFKPCASQRLFLPSLLSEVDAVVYVDTDILFLSPLHKIWAFFSQFNATQLVALAPEHEDPNVGWYNRFARHPYVPPLGVNSGVMLMNLTRLRQSTWLSSMMDYYKEYRLKITWGDQDLINIYFHDHPDELFIYSCEWNYRPDHCMYMSVCKPAERHGAFVIHGSRRVMHNDKQPAFKAVYSAFKDYKYGQDVQFVLLEIMKKKLKETTSTQCGKVSHIFLKQLEEFVMETQGHQAEDQRKPDVHNIANR